MKTTSKKRKKMTRSKRVRITPDFSWQNFLLKRSYEVMWITLDWDYCSVESAKAQLQDIFERRPGIKRAWYRRSSAKGRHVRIELDMPRADLLFRAECHDDTAQIVMDAFRPIWRRSALWSIKNDKQVGPWHLFKPRSPLNFRRIARHMAR